VLVHPVDFVVIGTIRQVLAMKRTIESVLTPVALVFVKRVITVTLLMVSFLFLLMPRIMLFVLLLILLVFIWLVVLLLISLLVICVVALITLNKK